MKTMLLLSGVAVLVFLNFCNPPGPATDLDEEFSGIRTVLEKYEIANEDEDFSIIEEIWADDDAIILIGTERDEKLVGWEEIRKAVRNQHRNFENTLISITEQMININETANTAWFSEELSYNFIYEGEAMSYEGIRFTGVLEKIDGKWKLVQGHLSMPAETKMSKEMTNN
ncbi:MAG: nuclear transport factor 2 family protein [Bacteroidales bacterium]